MNGDAKAQDVSFAEALAALSIATDLAKGQRKQSAMGAALLASRMAKLENTVRDLGIEVDDALKIAEQVEL